ncbi:MAG: sensor histidine kinase [Burkholderiales bacterium]
MQVSSQLPSFVDRVSDTVWRLSQRWWRLLVIAMLLLLHLAVFRGVNDFWGRGLLVAHLGLLLLWQPFVRGQQAIPPLQAGLIALVAAAVMWRLDWWMLVAWAVVLSGIVGGKVYQHAARWQRRFYLTVFLYLLALLVVAILPEVAPRREISADILMYAEFGLPLLFIAMALMPVEPESPESPQVIDFFYSVFLMLVIGMVVLGGFTFMTIGSTSYLQAITYTVFAMAGAVLLIGLAWSPGTGYAGLNVFVSRYLFSIGMPLEKWLYFLAELLHAEARPERFLAEGVAGLARLPWVSGARWSTPAESGEVGAETPHTVEYSNRSLSLRIYSRYRTSPVLNWHLQLLGQLLGEFYVAKLREEKLRQQSYMQAVHETGARMTHDVKNLLQSLNVLCTVAAKEEGTPEQQALIRRQLPAIAQRLAETLEQLQRPQPPGEGRADAQAWWDALARQYRSAGVEFAARALRPGIELPRALFDSVADNLIQNALAKRGADDSARVRAELACNGKIELRVIDSGAAVPPALAKSLFSSPIESSGPGLGLGLYQSARLAEAAGYALTLESNRDGEVCFLLAGPVTAA